MYTGLAEDQMYFVVRGQDLEAIADVLEVVSSANAALSDYAIGDLPAVPYASTPTSDGKYLLVACMAKHLLLAIDMSTLKIAKSFDLPDSPSEILATPDGAIAFVSCVSAGKIAVLDLRAWQLQAPIVLTAGVDGLAWVPPTAGNKAR